MIKIVISVNFSFLQFINCLGNKLQFGFVKDFNSEANINYQLQ